MKRAFSILICVIVLAALCACSGAADVSVAYTEWQLTGAALNSGDKTIEVNGADQLASYGIEGELVFEASSFVLTLVGNEQTGVYTQKADIITLTDGSGDAFYGVLDGDTLVIEDDGIGTLCFSRK